MDQIKRIETNAKLSLMCQEISSCLTLAVDRTNGDHVNEILQQLIVIQDISSSAYAMAKGQYAEVRGYLYSLPEFKGLTAYDKKAIIEGELNEELLLSTLTERLAASVSHGIEGYRSLLSYLKAEMTHLNYSQHQ